MHNYFLPPPNKYSGDMGALSMHLRMVWNALGLMYEGDSLLKGLALAEPSQINNHEEKQLRLFFECILVKLMTNISTIGNVKSTRNANFYPTD